MSSNTAARSTRHITLARTIGERLFINFEGRIFVVGGKPEFAKLLACLSAWTRPPRAAESPTPEAFGIHSCDGEITAGALHEIGRALHRWQQELALESQCRPAHRRTTKMLTRDLQEAERLADRLRRIREWQATLASGGEPAGAPLFLDATADVQLQLALRTMTEQFERTPLISWQARVICWLAGPAAVQRFLSSWQRLLASPIGLRWCEQLHSLQRMLAIWKQRSQSEPERYLRHELASYLSNLDPQLIGKGQLGARLRQRTFAEHCDRLLDRCTELVRSDENLRSQLAPAAIAALVAADGSKVALPQCWFATDAEQHGQQTLIKAIGRVAQQIGKPGYDALLAAIDQLPRENRECDYDLLCSLLGKGQSIADILWLYRYNLLRFVPDGFFDIARARRLSEAFPQSWQLRMHELAWICTSLSNPEQWEALEAWQKWLASVSPRCLTPRMLQTIQTTFWDVFIPSIRRTGWCQHFRPALEPLRLRGAPESDTAWQTRIQDYQQWSGRGATLPKSLRSWLHWQPRRQQEQAHLARCQAAGTLTPSAQARLQQLEAAAPTRVNSGHKKLARRIEEAFLCLGLEAQRAIANHLAVALCREQLADIAAALPGERLKDCARWLSEMSANDRRRLRQLIAAQAEHGPQYKRFLPGNRAWIAQAAERGIDMPTWLQPASEEITVGEQRLEITVSSVLHEIFQMGSYFGTCLSMGQVNQMSVLTNAIDANKQVVLMFLRTSDGRRQVIGRQLIAVSSDIKLLGYCCYLRWPRSEKAHREAGQKAMSAFIGRLAARANLELADEGVPEELGDHFWYDDGTHPWLHAARAAWFEAQPKTLV